MRNNSRENASLLLATQDLLWNSDAVDWVLKEIDRIREYDLNKDSLESISDSFTRDLLSLSISKEFIEQYFSSENLSRLSLEEYITLLQQVPARFVTHVTRHGIRDRSSHHNYDWDLSFHKGFENILRNRSVQSIYDQDIQGNYTKENVENNFRRINPGELINNKERLNMYLRNNKYSYVDSEFADDVAIHGAIDYVADDYYGAEIGNSIFVLYPAANSFTIQCSTPRKKYAKEVLYKYKRSLWW